MQPMDAVQMYEALKSMAQRRQIVADECAIQDDFTIAKQIAMTLAEGDGCGGEQLLAILSIMVHDIRAGERLRIQRGN